MRFFDRLMHLIGGGDPLRGPKARARLDQAGATAIAARALATDAPQLTRLETENGELVWTFRTPTRGKTRLARIRDRDGKVIATWSAGVR